MARSSGKLKLKYVTNEKGKYWYVDFGKGQKFLRLWVDRKFVWSDGAEAYLMLPVLNCKIIQKENGTRVLKPGEGVLYSVRVYVPWKDGDAEIEIDGKPEMVVEFEERVKDSKKKGWIIWFSEKSDLVAKVKVNDGKVIEVKKALQ